MIGREDFVHDVLQKKKKTGLIKPCYSFMYILHFLNQLLKYKLTIDEVHDDICYPYSYKAQNLLNSKKHTVNEQNSATHGLRKTNKLLDVNCFYLTGTPR